MITTTKTNLNFFLLLTLTFVTSFAIIALLAKIYPLFAAKAVYFCQQFVSNTHFSLPYYLPNIIVTTAIFIILAGIVSFLIQLYQTHRLLKRFSGKFVKLPKSIEKLTVNLNLQGRVYLIKDDGLFSFCSGIFSPRITITTAFSESLSNKELEAVLLHELSHVQNHDPLKKLFGKTIATMFFFLPIFSDLNKKMNADSEIRADCFTIYQQEDTVFLKRALKKILIGPQVSFATVSALSNPDYLEIRIQGLNNPLAQTSFPLSLMSIVTSMVFIALSWFILQTPVHAFNAEDISEHSYSQKSFAYFLCASDNSCSQQCSHNSQILKTSSPEQLFSKDKYIPTSYSK